MKQWVKDNFRIGTLFTILVTIITVSGAAYVVKDHVGQNTIELKEHTDDGHPAVVLSKIETQEVVLTQMKEDIGKKLDADVFEAYQVSQKELDQQFQKQLFIQLERIEGKLP